MKSIDKELDLPSLEDALEEAEKLKEKAAEFETEAEEFEAESGEDIDDPRVDRIATALNKYTADEAVNNSIVDAREIVELDEEMDRLAEDAEDYMHDLMDHGMNAAPNQQARMFEIASTFMGHAISARNNKVDKKLKLMKLQLDQARFERQLAKDQEAAQSSDTVINSEGVVIADRNALMRQKKEQK